MGGCASKPKDHDSSSKPLPNETSAPALARPPDFDSPNKDDQAKTANTTSQPQVKENNNNEATLVDLSETKQEGPREEISSSDSRKDDDDDDDYKTVYGDTGEYAIAKPPADQEKVELVAPPTSTASAPPKQDKVEAKTQVKKSDLPAPQSHPGTG